MTVLLPSGCRNLSWFVPPLLTKPFRSKNRTTSLRLTILSPILFTVNSIYNLFDMRKSAGFACDGRSRVSVLPPVTMRRLCVLRRPWPFPVRRWRHRFLPCLYDSQLVLRADGARPACIFSVLARFLRASNVILVRRACAPSAVSTRRLHRSLAAPTCALLYRKREGVHGTCGSRVHIRNNKRGALLAGRLVTIGSS